MALFSDGPLSTIDELVQHDSFLLAVASTEGIDVTAKLSLAHDEVETELSALFARASSNYGPVLGQTPLDTAHLAVTPALKLWYTFRTLELVYRDAYYNQLNDRYKGKWTEYQNLGRWATGKFLETGAGLVADPISIPVPLLTQFNPASQAGGTVYATITLLNSAGEESSPAILSEVTVPDAAVMVASISSHASNAKTWNLYTGSAPGVTTLQNSTPLALADTWEVVFPMSALGRLPGSGQAPNEIRDLPRRIMRG